MQVSATSIRHGYSDAFGNKYEFKGNLYAFAKSDRKSDDRNLQIEDTIDGGYYHHQSITIYCRYWGQKEEDAPDDSQVEIYLLRLVGRREWEDSSTGVGCYADLKGKIFFQFYWY